MTSTGSKIYHDLHPEIRLQSKTRVVGDLPVLPRLWKTRSTQSLSSSGKDLLPFLTSYADIFWEGVDHTNDGEVLESLVLHLCTHIIKSREVVVRHNARLKKKAVEREIESKSLKSNRKRGEKNSRNGLEGENDIDSTEIGSAYQDQGFTRARILILAPFRGSAFDIVTCIKQCLGKSSTISQWDKFEEEFGWSAVDDDSDLDMNKRKPDDWKHIFAQNVDDDFKIGLQVNPGQGKGNGDDKGSFVRLYSGEKGYQSIQRKLFFFFYSVYCTHEYSNLSL